MYRIDYAPALGPAVLYGNSDEVRFVWLLAHAAPLCHPVLVGTIHQTKLCQRLQLRQPVSRSPQWSISIKAGYTVCSDSMACVPSVMNDRFYQENSENIVGWTPNRFGTVRT
jgi:hypothetical protein